MLIANICLCACSLFVDAGRIDEGLVYLRDICFSVRSETSMSDDGDDMSILLRRRLGLWDHVLIGLVYIHLAVHRRLPTDLFRDSPYDYLLTPQGFVIQFPDSVADHKATVDEIFLFLLERFREDSDQIASDIPSSAFQLLLWNWSAWIELSRDSTSEPSYSEVGISAFISSLFVPQVLELLEQIPLGWVPILGSAWGFDLGSRVEFIFRSKALITEPASRSFLNHLLCRLAGDLDLVQRKTIHDRVIRDYLEDSVSRSLSPRDYIDLFHQASDSLLDVFEHLLLPDSSNDSFNPLFCRELDIARERQFLFNWLTLALLMARNSTRCLATLGCLERAIKGPLTEDAKRFLELQ